MYYRSLEEMRSSTAADECWPCAVSRAFQNNKINPALAESFAISAGIALPSDFSGVLERWSSAYIWSREDGDRVLDAAIISAFLLLLVQAGHGTGQCQNEAA